MALQIIYDRILDFPVFHGLGKNEMADIVARTKFDFHKYAPGRTIVRQNDPCSRLYFFLQGTISCEKDSDDYGYTLREEIPAPLLFQPEDFFGYSQRFSRTAVALTEVSLMTVDKEEVQKFLQQYHIVRMNVVNQLATHIQRLASLAWKHQSDDLEQRIINFISLHCLRPVGRKVLKIKMTRLAHELNDSRRNVSGALNALQEKSLVILQRGRIEIPAMEQLLNRFTLKNE